jgi:hypothetical protein
MGLFNSPVLVRLRTTSGRILFERVVQGGDVFTIDVPDSFADDYVQIDRGRGQRR